MFEPVFPDAMSYLRSLPNFNEAPDDYQTMQRVGGLDGRVGKYVGWLSERSEGEFNYHMECVLLFPDGSAWKFGQFSLFPVLEEA